MSSRLLGLLLGITLTVAAVQTWRIADIAQRDTLAYLEIRATNAGIALKAEDGEVSLHPAGQPERQVARGQFRERLKVPPGRYDVRAMFTRARDAPTRWSEESIALKAGQSAIYRVEFAAGELTVEAPVADGSGNVMVYVFAAGERTKVTTAMRAGEPVILSPAKYDLRVVLTQDSEEKMVRWRQAVPVKTGLQTQIEVAFERGQLTVSARNGEKVLPDGAVELTLFQSGDAMGKLVATGHAGTPLHLPVGSYDVRATFTAGSDAPERWLRDVSIEDGGDIHSTVDFSSGSLRIAAYLGDIELERYQAYVYAYRAGQHVTPVAYASAPDPLVLESGRYDVRVTYVRAHDQPSRWLYNVEVPVQRTHSTSVRFESGRLLVRAYDAKGEAFIGDRVFVTVFASGARHGPVAIARAGELLTLSEGKYDVRLQDTTRPSAAPRWHLGAHVETGQRSELDIIFEHQ